MRRQRNYQVISTKSLAELQKEVEVELKKGWECTGGICAVDTSPKSFPSVDLSYHQAMVMYADYGD